MTGSLHFDGLYCQTSKWIVTYWNEDFQRYEDQSVNYPEYGSNTWNFYYNSLTLSPCNVPVSFSMDSQVPGATLESKE